MSTFQLSLPTPPYQGQHHGNYRLIKRLGRGGFAAVFRVEHLYLRTLASVKILCASLAHEEKKRFLYEARIAARLKHEHIIRVLEFGVQEHVPFLVMDYAPRGTLRQIYPPGLRLPADLIVEYVWEITSALQYLHDNGLIHRDVKPANLLLGTHNELLLSDFGITVARQEAQVDTAGTAAYMAPEQINGAPCYASDQYALAVIVYEWLCGELPFSGSDAKILYQHLSLQPPGLSAKNPDLRPDVEAVMFRALAKDPADRFSSVSTFAEALEEAFFGTTNNAFVDKGEEELHVSRASSPAPGGRPCNLWQEICKVFAFDLLAGTLFGSRSEERRVGKECRSRCSR